MYISTLTRIQEEGRPRSYLGSSDKELSIPLSSIVDFFEKEIDSLYADKNKESDSKYPSKTYIESCYREIEKIQGIIKSIRDTVSPESMEILKAVFIKFDRKAPISDIIQYIKDSGIEPDIHKGRNPDFFYTPYQFERILDIYTIGLNRGAEYYLGQMLSSDSPDEVVSTARSWATLNTLSDY